MKHFLILSLALLCLAGCLSLNNHEPTQVTRYLPKDMQGCLFIANGSGDTGSLSENLEKALRGYPASIQLETFNWSHGAGQSFTDHVDRDNHTYQAQRLADQLVRFAAASKNAKAWLIGHSSGCAVLLAAAERMPPGSIERIVLLAPSVPDNYDLRPALTASRQGIDSYHSRNDTLILGLGMKILSTTDPDSHDAAGLNGFRIPVAPPADAALYQRLRQYPWNASFEKSGNDGGHYGSIQPGFLKAYVLPTMLGSR